MSVREVGSQAKVVSSGKLVTILEVIPADANRAYTMYMVKYTSGKYSADLVRMAEVMLRDKS
jgi:hypothetical protein